MKFRWKRWLKFLAAVTAALLAVVVILLILVHTGWLGGWVRRGVIAQIEKMSGGRVELKQFRFNVLALRAELDDFTLHGREAEGLPPFFHADSIVVDLRVISVFGRKVTVDAVFIENPVLDLRFDKYGNSNSPIPKRPAAKPWNQRIFDLTIQELRLNHGLLMINDVRVPLAVEGGEFSFVLDYRAGEAGKEFYEGTASWQKMKLAARRYLPFQSDWRVKFTLGRDGMEV
ncbi:MAG TPA: hypothetical protein VGQ11_13370, partial [Candidatus Acidoferrales bacterium]|nr:hypothetical protein [Candidatus Acidoferrales bacterium]